MEKPLDETYETLTWEDTGARTAVWKCLVGKDPEMVRGELALYLSITIPSILVSGPPALPTPPQLHVFLSLKLRDNTPSESQYLCQLVEKEMMLTAIASCSLTLLFWKDQWKQKLCSPWITASTLLPRQSQTKGPTTNTSRLYIQTCHPTQIMLWDPWWKQSTSATQSSSWIKFSGFHMIYPKEHEMLLFIPPLGHTSQPWASLDPKNGGEDKICQVGGSVFFLFCLFCPKYSCRRWAQDWWSPPDSLTYCLWRSRDSKWLLALDLLATREGTEVDGVHGCQWR